MAARANRDQTSSSPVQVDPYCLTERWDLRRVRALIGHLPDNHHDIPCLKAVLEKAQPDQDVIEFTVQHRHAWTIPSGDDGEDVVCGRMYGIGPRIQLPSRLARNYIFRDYLYDIDMVNAHPTILAQICKDNNIESPCLERYTSCDRENIIKEIIETHQEQQLSREIVKEAFIIGQFGGNYLTSSKCSVRHEIDFLSRYRDEMGKMCEILKDLPKYNYIWKEAERVANDLKSTGKRKWENPRGAFLARLCTLYEARIWISSFRLIKERLPTAWVMANLYDGLMTSQLGTDGKRCDPDEIVAICNEAAAGVGFPKMRFSEKPLDHVELEDFVKTPEAVKDFCAGDKVVVVSIECCIESSYYSQELGEWVVDLTCGTEGLAVLRDRDFKVCIWMKEEDTTLLAMVEHKIGPGFKFYAVISTKANGYWRATGETRNAVSDPGFTERGREICDAMVPIPKHMPKPHWVTVIDNRHRLLQRVGADNRRVFAIQLEAETQGYWPKRLHTTGLKNAVDRVLNTRVLEKVDYARSDKTIGRSLQPILLSIFNENIKMVLIRADLGSGKTHQIVQLIISFYKKHGRWPRLLIITARIQQAITAMSVFSINPESTPAPAQPTLEQVVNGQLNQPCGIHDLPPFLVKLYSDLLGKDLDADRNRLQSCHALSCQYESLHNVIGGKSYDLVIVDEIRSVLVQMATSVTNKRKIHVNKAALVGVLQAPGTIVVAADCHAEVDQCVADFADHVLPGQWVLQRYTEPALKVKFQPRQPEAMMRDLIQRIKSGQLVLVPCRAVGLGKNGPTPYSLEDIVGRLQEEGCFTGGGKYLAFKGGDQPKQMRDVFSNPDRALSDPNLRLVVFTPALTVGADFQRWFDKIMIFANARGGPSARDMDQMWARARNVRDPVIDICFPPKAKEKEGQASFKPPRRDVLEIEEGFREDQKYRERRAEQVGLSTVDGSDQKYRERRPERVGLSINSSDAGDRCLFDDTRVEADCQGNLLLMRSWLHPAIVRQLAYNRFEATQDFEEQFRWLAAHNGRVVLDAEADAADGEEDKAEEAEEAEDPDEAEKRKKAERFERLRLQRNMAALTVYDPLTAEAVVDELVRARKSHREPRNIPTNLSGSTRYSRLAREVLPYLTNSSNHELLKGIYNAVACVHPERRKDLYFHDVLKLTEDAPRKKLRMAGLLRTVTQLAQKNGAGDLTRCIEAATSAVDRHSFSHDKEWLEMTQLCEGFEHLHKALCRLGFNSGITDINGTVKVKALTTDDESFIKKQCREADKALALTKPKPQHKKRAADEKKKDPLKGLGIEERLGSVGLTIVKGRGKTSCKKGAKRENVYTTWTLQYQQNLGRSIAMFGCLRRLSPDPVGPDSVATLDGEDEEKCGTDLQRLLNLLDAHPRLEVVPEREELAEADQEARMVAALDAAEAHAAALNALTGAAQGGGIAPAMPQAAVKNVPRTPQSPCTGPSAAARRSRAKSPRIREPPAHAGAWAGSSPLQRRRRSLSPLACLRPGEMLDGETINAFLELLKSSMPGLEGGQDVYVGVVEKGAHLKKLLGEAVQIIHCPGPHWVCVVFTVDGDLARLKASVMDSIAPPRGGVRRTVFEVVQELLDEQHPTVESFGVGQQRGSVDCGLFACAYATLWALGSVRQGQECQRLYQDGLREWLRGCLEKSRIVDPPTL